MQTARFACSFCQCRLSFEPRESASLYGMTNEPRAKRAVSESSRLLPPQPTVSRLASVIGDRGKPERAKVVRIEGKDVFDIALVGEDTGRVIDE